jgi:putative MATE family efflux protein
MGMPGAALASAIAHVVAFGLLIIKLPSVKVKLEFAFTAFFKNALEILRIGMPVGLLGAIFSIIYIILSKNIAYFGTVPMAAISIAHRIEGIPFFIAFGFSTAVATVVGQNLGACKPNRAEKGAHLALVYAGSFLLLISICLIFYSKSILSFFINDQAVIEAGYRYLFAIAIFEVFLAPEVILEGAFTGAGDTKPPFFISIPLTFIRIPLAYYFSIILNYGVVAIWWVIGFTMFLKGVTFFLWFQRGKWKERMIG